MREMKLQDLKAQTPAELVSFAEEKGVENASTMRKQELMFAILKQLAIQTTLSAKASSKFSPTDSDAYKEDAPTKGSINQLTSADGTFRKCRDVRYMVANGVRADVTRTTHFG